MPLTWTGPTGHSAACASATLRPCDCGWDIWINGRPPHARCCIESDELRLQLRVEQERLLDMTRQLGAANNTIANLQQHIGRINTLRDELVGISSVSEARDYYYTIEWPVIEWPVQRDFEPIEWPPGLPQDVIEPDLSAVAFVLALANRLRGLTGSADPVYIASTVLSFLAQQQQAPAPEPETTAVEPIKRMPQKRPIRVPERKEDRNENDIASRSRT